MSREAQLASAYSVSQVQEEVDSRVAALRKHVVGGISILNDVIAGVTVEVRYLLSFIGAQLRDWCRKWSRTSKSTLKHVGGGGGGPSFIAGRADSSFAGNGGGSGGGGGRAGGGGGAIGGRAGVLGANGRGDYAVDSNEQGGVLVERELGHIVVRYLLRNLLVAPKSFNLLPHDVVITGRLSSNLERLVQVLDRVVGNRFYGQAVEPWMQPLNSVVLAETGKVSNESESDARWALMLVSQRCALCRQ